VPALSLLFIAVPYRLGVQPVIVSHRDTQPQLDDRAVHAVPTQHQPVGRSRRQSPPKRYSRDPEPAVDSDADTDVEAYDVAISSEEDVAVIAEPLPERKPPSMRVAEKNHQQSNSRPVAPQAVVNPFAVATTSNDGVDYELLPARLVYDAFVIRVSHKVDCVCVCDPSSDHCRTFLVFELQQMTVRR
jgi:hypothetical protein